MQGHKETILVQANENALIADYILNPGNQYMSKDKGAKDQLQVIDSAFLGTDEFVLKGTIWVPEPSHLNV